MPIKVWSEEDGSILSEIMSNWDHVITAEEHRSAAEGLDAAYDRILDAAVEDLQTAQQTREGTPPDPFSAAHTVGQAFRDSSVLSHEALAREPYRFIWFALAQKCRLGVRSDGRRTDDWRPLRPRRDKPPRREGGRGTGRSHGDHFEMCTWLAEQDLDSATRTFGGSVRNVWQMLDRPSLEPLGVRLALLKWLDDLPIAARAEAVQREQFAELMKALGHRWPARGPGSAIKPIHLTEQEIEEAVYEALGAPKSRTTQT